MAAATSPLGPPTAQTDVGQKEVVGDDLSCAYAWKRCFNEPNPSRSMHKPAKPGALEIVSLLPIAARVGSYVHSERKAGREPIFDLSGFDLHPPDPGPVGGVPLGGIGCGTIGRSWRGDFSRWSLWPGRYRHTQVAADQFAVRVAPVAASGTRSPQGVVLNAPSAAAARNIRKASSLRAWDWGLKADSGTYHGLFPRAWTTYTEPIPGLKLTCKQVSPVLPDDYATSSIPAAAFVWTVQNVSDEPLEVSLLFSFQNGDGGPGDAGGGHRNEAFDSEKANVFTLAPAEAAKKAMAKDRATAVASAARAATGATSGEAKEADIAKAEASTGGSLAQGQVLRGVSLIHNHRTRVVFNPSDDSTSRKTPSSASTSSAGSGGGGNSASGGGGIGSTAPSPAMGSMYTDSLTLGIAAIETPGQVSVSCVESFDTGLKTDGGARAEAMWQSFVEHGCLPDAADSSTSGTASGDVACCGSRAAVRAGVEDERVEAPEKTSKKGKPPKPLYSPTTGASVPGATLGAAICQRMESPLQPGEKRELVFSLSWDSPIVRFGSGKALPRRYSRFFGRDGDAAPALATYALMSWSEWDKRISAWQRPILEQPDLPAFYKSLLFNELYFIVDGGSVWTDSTRGEANPLAISNDGEVGEATGAAENDGNKHEGHGEQSIFGQFLYLEGHEYLMYNTYDVHFYASFALASNWPMLQLSLQRDFARAVMQGDEGTVRKMLGSGVRVPRKVPGAVPHDLGSPCEEPWTKINVYNFQDVSRWKDLGPKFVLSVLRDFRATASVPFVRDVFPTVVTIMRTTASYDLDGDGLIENSGFPDQTYDIWSVQGPSAYTGGLWVAALAAAVRLGQIVVEDMGANGKEMEGDLNVDEIKAVVAEYEEMYQRAQVAYESKLWNGSYYNYDSSSSYQSDSIMADQMAGQWYARACGLPSIVAPERARSALRKVYTHNVMQFGDGKRGAVNGMRPDTGKADQSSMQSREVWTGTTYAAAAAMLQESYFDDDDELDSPAVPLRQAAFATIRGIWQSGWKDFGYWFATPEAWELNGNYRSIGYMRPLSVWALHWAMVYGKNEANPMRQNIVVVDEA